MFENVRATCKAVTSLRAPSVCLLLPLVGSHFQLFIFFHNLLHKMVSSNLHFKNPTGANQTILFFKYCLYELKVV